MLIIFLKFFNMLNLVIQINSSQTPSNPPFFPPSYHQQVKLG